MKRRIISLFLICITLSLLTFSSYEVSAKERISAYQSPGATVGVSLGYVLIVSSESGVRCTGHVKLNMSNLNAYQVTLTMAEFLGGFFPIPIQNFIASNEKGNRLLVTEFRKSHPYGDERFWKIDANYASQVRVEYDVVLNFSRIERGSALERQHKGYLGKEFGVTVAAWTFLVPIGISVRNIEIKFDLPPRWISATPWEKSMVGYRVDSVDYLVTSTYAIGKFSVRSREIAGTNVSIALYADWTENLQQKIADNFFKLFEYMTMLFRGSPLPVYLAICHPPTEDLGEVRGEWSQSQSLVVLESYDIAGVTGALAHALFHSWNLFPPYGMQQKSNEESWFREGTNIYYQWDKALIKIGLLRRHSVLASFDFPTYMKEYVGTKYDVPVTEAYKFDNPQESEKLSFLVYRKGALISFLLDQTIQKLTGMDRSLDDLVAIMYERYGGKGYDGRYWSRFYSETGYSNLDIIRFLGKITGFDFKPFFDNYIYGKEVLPLRIEHGDLAADWPKLLAALKLTNIPLMTLTLSNDSAKIGETITLKTKLISLEGKPIINQTISFYLNSTLIGTAITDSSGLAVLTFKVEVSEGTYQVVVHYAGSTEFLQSKEMISFIVEKLDTSLNLDVPTTVIQGTSLVIEVVLKDERGLPIQDAIIDFYVKADGEWSKVGSSKTDGNGIASCSYTPDKIGKIGLKATYWGDARRRESYATATLAVAQAIAAVPPNFKQLLVLTVTVAILGLAALLLIDRTGRRRVDRIES